MSGLEVCAGAVVVVDGRLLLVRRVNDPGAGLWSVPGGRVNTHEAPSTAAVRELWEETGLVGTVLRPIGWVERTHGDRRFLIIDYSVAVADPSAARAGDDASELSWVTLAEVADHPRLVEGLAQFLADHHVIA